MCKGKVIKDHTHFAVEAFIFTYVSNSFATQVFLAWLELFLTFFGSHTSLCGFYIYGKNRYHAQFVRPTGWCPKFFYFSGKNFYLLSFLGRNFYFLFTFSLPFSYFDLFYRQKLIPKKILVTPLILTKSVKKHGKTRRTIMD